MALDDDPQDQFDWEGTPAPDPTLTLEAIVDEPRRVGPRVLIGGGLAAAALVAVLVIALGAGAGTNTQNSPVVLASDVTTQAPGYKFSLTVNVNAGEQNVGLSGSGAIDNGPPLNGTVTMTVAGLSVNERLIGSDVYVQSPTMGDSWGHLSLSGLPGFGGTSSSSQYTSTDPAAMLAYLRSAGTVTDEGPQNLGGVATTHYHAVVDLAQYAASLPAAQQAAVQSAEQTAGLSSFPIDAWVDGSDRVRQLNLDLSIDVQSVQASVTYSMSFYDYGPQAAVSAPPASEIIELPGLPSTSTPSAPAQTPAPSGSGSTEPAD
jgi:hypothetical protein